MPSNPTTTAGIEAVDYEYVQSCGAHGVHAHGQFDAFVGSQREIWIGSDGSGLIRGTSGPASFFTEDGRARWEAADSRELTHGPSVDLFAPGCLPGSRARRARLQRHPDGRKAALSARSPLTLHTVQELLGEALVRAKSTSLAHRVQAAAFRAGACCRSGCGSCSARTCMRTNCIWRIEGAVSGPVTTMLLPCEVS
jgi:hypothetical protein